MTSLTQLIDCKQDIKSAIIEKGVEVTGGLTSYADAIRQIKSGISSLIEVPINTRFYGSKWTAAPIIETDNWTDMSSMFYNCTNMTYIPRYDTSSVTSMDNMFTQCYSLKTIPLLDTSKVIDMGFMFYNCTSLTSLPTIDAGRVRDVEAMFYYCTSLTDIKGLSNLGMYGNLTGTDALFKDCDKLTYESILNVINNLYDRATAGYSVLTLQVPKNVLALLSDEDIAIATDKGWTISY